MEEIFSRLSEIEEEASALLRHTDTSRQRLSDDYERKMKAFDQSLEKEKDAKITRIREDLEKEKDSRLQSLREETARSIQQLDLYYEEHHEELAQKLFQQLLEPERK